MKIHEYQAKDLFRKGGIRVPRGEVVTTPDAAYDVAAEYGRPVVVKAQVLVGGRGKAGGVKLARNPDEARNVRPGDPRDGDQGPHRREGARHRGRRHRRRDLRRRDHGPPIADAARHGVRGGRRRDRGGRPRAPRGDPPFDASIRGTGFSPFQARALAGRAPRRLRRRQQQIAAIVDKLYRVFDAIDASLAEINPLVVTPTGEVVAIDAKVNIDDNALYRQQDIEEMRDVSAEDPGEAEARKRGSLVRQAPGKRRLHRERRRARDGDDGPHQDLRRRARQLPRHRRELEPAESRERDQDHPPRPRT